MRLIGHIKDETNARIFGDYLSGLEIPNRVEPESEGGWAIWVISEEQLGVSREWFNQFTSDPTAPCFVQGAAKAAELNTRRLREQREYEQRIRTPSTIWRSKGFGMTTLTLIGLCVIAAVFSGFNSTASQLNPLRLHLPDVLQGQVWRLVTPIFIHSGPLHLFFNMLWLNDLGNLIESREGSLKLVILVVVIAALSNLGQYFVSGPWFNGMSGVVFGLFGYVWLRGKFDPRAGYMLDSSTVGLMIAWFFICAFGLMNVGNVRIANMCHGVGLGAGMFWGWVEAKARN